MILLVLFQSPQAIPATRALQTVIEVSAHASAHSKSTAATASAVMSEGQHTSCNVVDEVTFHNPHFAPITNLASILPMDTDLEGLVTLNHNRLTG